MDKVREYKDVSEIYKQEKNSIFGLVVMSESVVGAVLGQRKGRVFHAIYYASKVLNDAQINYATT